MTDRRKRIAEKVAALKRKTVEAGCSEAEAMSAAALAAKLMAEHGLNEDDIEIVQASTNVPRDIPLWQRSLLGAISEVTNTAAIWTQPGRGQAVVTFYGKDPGPEIASYLRDVLLRACAAEQRRFKALDYYRFRSRKAKAKALEAFNQGLGLRLSMRLVTLFSASMNATERQKAKDVAARVEPEAENKDRKFRKTGNPAAMAEGYRRGGDITLQHGGGAAAPLAIEAKP